ncbi:matrix metalloproteinase-16-like protein [Dinothrombium tinctorium]|uniref:Matrix metalloproteinase-16-like protein n=1 Tax=Dinothrombium tinctorium TaxID=1965070 RepID=A0A3S3PBL9_9ACAR|nr:matrix metalloproteinase-16-like protein [Dinothrombium tinctorium]
MQRFNDSKVDPTEPEKSDDDICSSTEFDAATTINNVTYLFRGEYFFTIDSTGSIERKGRKISDEFPNIPSDLDAAVTTRDGITYFFKGDQYYQAGGRRGESAPRPIHSHFRNVPNDLDAAFVYSKDGLIYFVKDFDAATTIDNVTYLFRGKYYFTIDSNGKIERKGRKISDEFINIPSDLDAAVTTRDGITYFFKGDQYYQAGGRRGESAPRPIHSHFRNVPNDLDAAFVYSKDGLIYFVKDKKFFRFDNDNGVELSDDERYRAGFDFDPYNLKAAFSTRRNNFFLFPWYYYRVSEKGGVQDHHNIGEILKCSK